MRSDFACLVLDSVWLTSSSCFRTSVSWAMSRSVTLIDCCCDMEVKTRTRRRSQSPLSLRHRVYHDSCNIHDLRQDIRHLVLSTDSTPQSSWCMRLFSWSYLADLLFLPDLHSGRFAVILTFAENYPICHYDTHHMRDYMNTQFASKASAPIMFLKVYQAFFKA